MKIVIKTLQGKQLPVEVEETFTVSSRARFYAKKSGWDLIFTVHNIGQTN